MPQLQDTPFGDDYVDKGFVIVPYKELDQLQNEVNNISEDVERIRREMLYKSIENCIVKESIPSIQDQKKSHLEKIRRINALELRVAYDLHPQQGPIEYTSL